MRTAVIWSETNSSRTKTGYSIIRDRIAFFQITTMLFDCSNRFSNKQKKRCISNSKFYPVRGSAQHCSERGQNYKHWLRPSSSPVWENNVIKKANPPLAHPDSHYYISHFSRSNLLFVWFYVALPICLKIIMRYELANLTVPIRLTFTYRCQSLCHLAQECVVSVRSNILSPFHRLFIFDELEAKPFQTRLGSPGPNNMRP